MVVEPPGNIMWWGEGGGYVSLCACEQADSINYIYIKWCSSCQFVKQARGERLAYPGKKISGSTQDFKVGSYGYVD